MRSILSRSWSLTFLVFALLQYNDPDGTGWAIYYAMVAVLHEAAQRCWMRSSQVVTLAIFNLAFAGWYISQHQLEQEIWYETGGCVLVGLSFLSTLAIKREAQTPASS